LFYLYVDLYSFDICPRMIQVDIFLVFWLTSILISIVVVQFTFTPTVYEDSFPPHPCQHLLSLAFLMIAILTKMRRNLSVVLISISFMDKNVEHFLMYLLTNWISLENSPFN
jgi:hypothetical protein